MHAHVFPSPGHQAHQELHPAIRWMFAGTVGNIAASSDLIRAPLTTQENKQTHFSCEMIEAGKFRNGAARWWCRTHFSYWGRKAELACLQDQGFRRCPEYASPMGYMPDPPVLCADRNEELAIRYALPPALTTMRDPAGVGQLLISRHTAGELCTLENTQRHAAVSVLPGAGSQAFANPVISRIHVTPPAALEFALAMERGQATGCVDCSRCGFPHLDLGSFAWREHRKHYCGNCGYDGTHSQTAMISTPLKPLHEQHGLVARREAATSTIDLKKYAGCQFALWPTLPAILWRVDKPEPSGIHVRIWRQEQILADDIVGEVVLENQRLQRQRALEISLGRAGMTPCFPPGCDTAGRVPAS